MFEIKKITVVVSHGTDAVMLHTDLPEGAWPFEKTGAVLKASVAHGKGKVWAENNFPGISVEVIKMGLDFQ